MFTFRLEKVLRHRAHRVDEESRELRRIEGEIVQLQVMRADVANDIMQLSAAGARERARGADVDSWRRLAEWIDSRRRDLQRFEAAERELHKQAERQRQRLLAARREREVLENLKERQRRLWAEGNRRLEQKELDDIGGRAHWNRAAAGREAPVPVGGEA